MVAGKYTYKSLNSDLFLYASLRSIGLKILEPFVQGDKGKKKRKERKKEQKERKKGKRKKETIFLF